MFCILEVGRTTLVAASAFTLSWTHSVERTRWEEEWRLTPAGLELSAARVKGSGAGMEAPDGAVLADGWWTWAPKLPVQTKLILAASGATGTGWTLCAGQSCTEIGASPQTPVELFPCGTSQPR